MALYGKSLNYDKPYGHRQVRHHRTSRWLDECDSLKSYHKPIKHMCKGTDHRQHKGLNNRVENAHQPSRRKEKGLIKFKSPYHIQKTLSLMGKTRNIFAVAVGRYKNTAQEQRTKFREAKEIWNFAASQAICA